MRILIQLFFLNELHPFCTAIFFEDVIGLKPVPLNSIWIITPFVQSIMTILVERLANKTNRFAAMIIFKTVGICQLMVMANVTMDRSITPANPFST